ncbi:MAG: hypothetical protein HQK49_01395 [Oligoflexia bacterium]|nr:hypothetical protein [Oligoflexia bacterium]
MSEISIKEILLRSLQKSVLAPFYIVTHPAMKLDFMSKRENLWKWSLDLLESVLRLYSSNDANNTSSSSSSILNHPDFLFISRRDIDREMNIENIEVNLDISKSYRINEFDEFFKFLNFKKFQLPYRFIIVEDAHLIEEELANKLLKSLEETPKCVSIFLLRPSEKEIIKTILSRAIKLRVDSNFFEMRSGNLSTILGVSEDESDIINKYIADYKRDGLISNMDKMRDSEILLNSFFNYVLELERLRVDESAVSYESKEEFLKEIKWYQTSLSFNNNQMERIYSLLDLYEKCAFSSK